MMRLHRDLAPLSSEAWEALDAEALTHLRHFLAARRLIELHGPTGAEALRSGRRDVIANDDVWIGRVRTVPVFELRRTFRMQRSEIDALERGAADVDFDPLREAARHIATAEDRIVFDGLPGTPTAGIFTAASHPALVAPPNFGDYPTTVAEAVATLRDAAVGGPYGIGLGPSSYRGVVETTERGGLVVFDHLREILGGPVIWAPSIDGAVVLSMRGGDFHLEVADDLALGYVTHDAAEIEFVLTETVGFRLDSNDAAVAIHRAV